MTPHEYAWVFISDVAVSAVVALVAYDIRDAWRSVSEFKRAQRQIREEKAQREAETRAIIAARNQREAAKKAALAEFDLRCFYCGFAKYYQDLRGGAWANEEDEADEAMFAPFEICRRCRQPVKWESAAEEQARTEGALKCNLDPWNEGHANAVANAEARGETVGLEGPGEA